MVILEWSFATRMFVQTVVLLLSPLLHTPCCVLVRRNFLGYQVQGFRLTQHWFEWQTFLHEDGHKTETCGGYRIKYSNQCCVRRKP
jgi:hypothetical protein